MKQVQISGTTPSLMPKWAQMLRYTISRNYPLVLPRLLIAILMKNSKHIDEDNFRPTSPNYQTYISHRIFRPKHMAITSDDKKGAK